MRTIFDIGSNNGDDIPYYFLKADRVVAFEANPILCRGILARFSNEVASGRLIVVEGVLCTDKDASREDVPFYLHKTHDVLSQFPEPPTAERAKFEMIKLKCHRFSDQITKYGHPYYAKIDIEHYDSHILSELFRIGVFPKYISAEAHSKKIVDLLTKNATYVGFKVVNGQSVQEKYSSSTICDLNDEKLTYAFPAHSAGPFGNDIEGPWYDRRSCSRLMIAEGLGWKDLHASRADEGEAIEIPLSMKNRTDYLKSVIRPKLPEPARRIYRFCKSLRHNSGR